MREDRLVFHEMFFCSHRICEIVFVDRWSLSKVVPYGSFDLSCINFHDCLKTALLFSSVIQSTSTVFIVMYAIYFEI